MSVQTPEAPFLFLPVMSQMGELNPRSASGTLNFSEGSFNECVVSDLNIALATIPGQRCAYVSVTSLDGQPYPANKKVTY